MTRIIFVLLTVVPTLASAQLTKIRSSDFKPNPAFVPVQTRQERAEGGVEQIGEVVILEGDDALVSSDGEGGYAIAFNTGTQNPLAITRRFFTRYPDQFDEIIIFTTFEDAGARGALAYEVSTKQTVQGLGRELFDDTNYWGGRNLTAFVNMMKWDQYKMFGRPLTDPQSDLYSTLGQEFAHAWLAFLRYKDGNGNISEAMLGRDGAHWASSLQSYGSLLDGVELVETAPGAYEVKSFMSRYSPLDLYAMGLLPAEGVKPFFRIVDPTDEQGRAIRADRWLFPGDKINGTPETITIEQIIAAEGERVPSSAESPHAFRVAFVLLTRPGERAGDVTEIARQLNEVRKVWERVFETTYTGGLGTMCTQVSAPCGGPTASIVASQVLDRGGNFNGVVEPGEDVWIRLTVQNDGPVAAPAVKLRATGPLVEGIVEREVGPLAPGQRREVLLTGRVPADAACGAPAMLYVENVVGDHTFRGFAQVVPGLGAVYQQGFEGDTGGWRVEGDAEKGWEYGTPVEYRARSGWLFQPGAGHADSKKAWFTALGPGTRPYKDSSVSVGRTMLVTPRFALASTYKPTLRYHAWFQAFDFSDPDRGGYPTEDRAMVLEGSADGETWVELDRVSGFSAEWQQRDVALDGKLPMVDTAQFRFVIENGDESFVVEAGVDDVQLFSLSAACRPAESAEPAEPPAPAGGCSVGGAAPRWPWVAVLALLLVLARRRRHA